jgi:hypothetical protein
VVPAKPLPPPPSISTELFAAFHVASTVHGEVDAVVSTAVFIVNHGTRLIQSGIGSFGSGEAQRMSCKVPS